MLIIAYSAACVVIVSLLYILSHFQYYRHAYKLPGHRLITCPIIGDLVYLIFQFPIYLNDPMKFGKSLLNKYGLIVRLWLPELTVLIASEKYTKHYFSRNDQLNKAHAYGAFKELIGEGSLIIANTQNLKESKQRFLKTFGSIPQEKIMNQFKIGIDDLLSKLEHHEGAGYFEMQPYLLFQTTENILRVTSGFGVNQTNLNNIFDNFDSMTIAAVFKYLAPKLVSEIVLRSTTLGRNFRTAEAQLKKIVENAVSLMKNNYRKHIESGSKEPSYTSNLLDELGESSDDAIATDMKTLVGAALDTTSVTMGYLMLMLGMHQDIQEKVHSEIIERQTLQHNEMPTSANIISHQYLQLVVKETLRLYPALPYIGRKLTEDVQYGEYTIPKGGNVIIAVPILHRDPEVFPNPLHFDPDRFLPENQAKIPKYAYIPFSHGLRSCPGKQYAMLSMMYTTIKIIRKYKVFSQIPSIEELEKRLIPGMIMNQKDHFPIRIEMRC